MVYTGTEKRLRSGLPTVRSRRISLDTGSVRLRPGDEVGREGRGSRPRVLQYYPFQAPSPPSSQTRRGERGAGDGYTVDLRGREPQYKHVLVVEDDDGPGARRVRDFQVDSRCGITAPVGLRPPPVPSPVHPGRGGTTEPSTPPFTTHTTRTRATPDGKQTRS